MTQSDIINNNFSKAFECIKCSNAYDTGAVLSEEKLFKQISERKHSTFDKSKFTVVGSPTITDDGVASGFSASNYLKVQSNVITYNNFRIDLEFDVNPALVTSTQNIFGFSFNAYARAELYTNGRINFVWIPTSGGVKECAITFNSIGTHYKYSTGYDGTNFFLEVECDGVKKTYKQVGTMSSALGDVWIGRGYRSDSVPFTAGSIDLKHLSITVDGKEVFSGNKTGLDVINEIEIPYTLSKTGSKIVDVAYRDRVIDLYEQEGKAKYYTIDEPNKNFTLPMGEIYGMIGGSSSSTGGSGLEICDIGMALYVDETKGLRRYLNGQIVDINANTQKFLNRLQQIATLHPSLLCTEEEWQTAKTMSAFGQVGKFVFNYSGDEVVSVRLPRVVNVQGLFDLQNLGMTVRESLPNIKGGYTTTADISGNISNATGAFNGSSVTTTSNYGGGSGRMNDTKVVFNAHNSSPIYQDNAPVQPEAIQYPYFIQIATGSETENNIINEIELNNPYSLFDSKYSDHELNNLSWLKSEGQWNAKAVYPTAYNELLKEYNNPDRLATFNKDAFKVVGSPTISDDGVASGFSGANYLTISNLGIDTYNITFTIEFIVPMLGVECKLFNLETATTNDTRCIIGASKNFYLYNNVAPHAITPAIKIPDNWMGDMVYATIELTSNGNKVILNNITKNTQLSSTSTNIHQLAFNSMTLGQGLSNNVFTSIDLKQFSITVDGVKVFSGAKSKVKLSTETYTDYDFVLNTADETFRLPLKTKLASGKAIVGNGMSLGLTDGTNNGSTYIRDMTNLGGSAVMLLSKAAYGTTDGTEVADDTSWGPNKRTIGVTTDSSKSGIELSDSGLYLYYYVGETVQNANLIDAGRIGEVLPTKTDKVQAAQASMPSSKYIDLTLGASGASYTAPANGFVNCGKALTGNGGYINITNVTKGYKVQNTTYYSGQIARAILPVAAGDNFVVSYDGNTGGSVEIFRFYYAEGEV